MPNKPTKDGPGRHAVHPPEDCKRLMTRSTIAEYEAWKRAAELEARRLGIPIERLTIGVWSRMILNQRSKELGVMVPESANENG